MSEKKKYIRKYTEAQREDARERSRRYYAEHGTSTQMRYAEKTVQLHMVFNKEKEGDLLSLYEGGKPTGTRTKELLRELMRLRETQALWKRAAQILTEDADGESESK